VVPPSATAPEFFPVVFLTAPTSFYFLEREKECCVFREKLVGKMRKK
jgi:hypothetical protein